MSEFRRVVYGKQQKRQLQMIRKKSRQTVITIRRISIFLGIFGMILLVLLSSPISLLTFGNTNYAIDIALLSFTLFCVAITGGQSALIQGMRRIGDLAKLNILGVLFGVVFSIRIIYIWGKKGIVPFLIVVAFMDILTSWWYARKIKIVQIQMGWADIWQEVGTLLKMGVGSF